MWKTPLGERALEGAEWALFREALGMLWDLVEMEFDTGEKELSAMGVGSFDRLTPNQKLAMLALVGRALRSVDVPAPELTSVSEGTVAAVFALLRDEADSELRRAASPTANVTAEEVERATFWRELVRAAYPEVEAVRAGEAEGEESGSEGDAVVPAADLPAVTSHDKEDWELMLDLLNDAVLWDTDYDTEELFLDAPPGQRVDDMEFLGVDEGYFMGIAPDPTDEELTEVRRVLSEVCGRL
jgi:hypothetical protein